jgi:hypothetical protein
MENKRERIYLANSEDLARKLQELGLSELWANFKQVNQ